MKGHRLAARLQGLSPVFPGVRKLCSQEQCLQHMGRVGAAVSTER